MSRKGRHGAPALTRCAATGKVRHPEKRSATTTLHHFAAGRAFAEADHMVSRRQECRAYKCAACHGWHLTSQGEHFRTATQAVVPAAVSEDTRQQKP